MVAVNNLLSRSCNIFHKIPSSLTCVYNIHFISAFFTQRARRSQPKRFTALNSRYYTYSFIQGSLRLN